MPPLRCSTDMLEAAVRGLPKNAAIRAATDYNPQQADAQTSAVQAVVTQDRSWCYCLDEVWLSRMRLISR